jgi:peptide/nickel transport system ATP-binding protein
VLDVRNLRKTYVSGGGLFSKKRVTHAVDDVSFSVKRGETLGIVGESGSGKSTIGKCLLRLTGVDGGQMLFDGQDIARLSERQFRPMRRDVQMIFQDPFASLNPRHTVGRIITDGPVATGVPLADAQARARELLQLVGLEASAFDRYPTSSRAASASASASPGPWRWSRSCWWPTNRSRRSMSPCRRRCCNCWQTCRSGSISR